MPNFWVLRWKKKFNPPEKLRPFTQKDEAERNHWNSVICTSPTQVKRFTDMLAKDPNVIQVEVKEKT